MKNKKEEKEMENEDVIIEVVPESFSEKGLKEAKKQKQILDYLGSNCKNDDLLQSIIDDVVKEKLEEKK